jgi:hypothetical protein
MKLYWMILIAPLTLGAQVREVEVARLTLDRATVLISATSDPGQLPVEAFAYRNGERVIEGLSPDEAAGFEAEVARVLAQDTHVAARESLTFRSRRRPMLQRVVTSRGEQLMVEFAASWSDLTMRVSRAQLHELVSALSRAAIDGHRLQPAYREVSADNPEPDTAEINTEPERPDAKVYFEYQVEQRAISAFGAARPQYPASLRGSGVTGSARAQFVVDTAGGVDLRTLKITAATNDLFITEVRRALPSMRFSPARIGGHAVRQLVMTEFPFTEGEHD